MALIATPTPETLFPLLFCRLIKPKLKAGTRASLMGITSVACCRRGNMLPGQLFNLETGTPSSCYAHGEARQVRQC